MVAACIRFLLPSSFAGIEGGCFAREAPSVDCGPSGIFPKVGVFEEVPMTRDVYAHPFSSHCQKVLIALYENGTRSTI